MRLLLQCAALCCALIATTAAAHPFTTDDLLRIEERVGLGASPDGRWLIIATTRGQAYAPRFDYGAIQPYAARRLYRVDLARPGAATPLLPQEDDAGYTAGPFSPDGQRVLVHRLRAHQWETGVVDIAMGSVRWLGVGADFTLFGRSVQWRSSHELVAVVTPPDQPHFIFRRGWQGLAWRSAAARVTAETGGPSVLSMGSGRFLDRGAPGSLRTLALIDADTGAITPLARGEFLDLELSASGRYVAAWGYGADVQPKAGETILGGTPARRRDLLVFDLLARRALQGCQDCDLSPFLLAWAPRSDRLLVYSRRPGETLAQGALTMVTPAEDRLDVQRLDQIRARLDYTYDGFEIPRAGWVGETPVALSRPSEAADDEPPAWRRLTAKGSTRLLPDGLPTPGLIRPDAQGRMLVIAGDKALRIEGARVATLGDAVASPTPQLGETGRPRMARVSPGDTLLVQRKGRLLALSARREQDLGPTPGDALLTTPQGWAVTASRDDHGRETLRAQRGRTLVDVLALNPQLGEVDFGPVRPVAHKGPHGEPQTSWIMLPADWRADRPPPLVVIPYPGLGVFAADRPPNDARPGAGQSAPVSAQVLAGHGYAVLYASLPHDRYPNEPARDLAAEILTAVDAVGALGLADTRRLALWGHSFGGQAVLSAATQSDRFKAIVCSAGVADMASAWGNFTIESTPEEGLKFTGRSAYFETGQMAVGAPPWAAPDRYVRNSALYQADKITAPVLLLYGDLDEYGNRQGGEMFAALYRQGKDARLLTFWGEGHVVYGPGNVRRLYAEGLDWLDRALGPPRSDLAEAPRP